MAEDAPLGDAQGYDRPAVLRAIRSGVATVSAFGIIPRREHGNICGVSDWDAFLARSAKLFPTDWPMNWHERQQFALRALAWNLIGMHEHIVKDLDEIGFAAPKPPRSVEQLGVQLEELSSTLELLAAAPRGSRTASLRPLINVCSWAGLNEWGSEVRPDFLASTAVLRGDLRAAAALLMGEAAHSEQRYALTRAEGSLPLLMKVALVELDAGLFVRSADAAFVSESGRAVREVEDVVRRAAKAGLTDFGVALSDQLASLPPENAHPTR